MADERASMRGAESDASRKNFFTVSILVGAAIFFSTAARGTPGVVMDGSFGAAGALPLGPNSTYTIGANLGRQIGPNLFQSFLDFNLTSGQTANFTATGSTAPISNILARVTGGSSSIDGTIESQITGANLFLLNPAGVMFGPHAQVNVSGSFVVGTPDYVKLAGGGKFNTALGNDSQLTSASVSAFGFLSASPAPVSFAGSQLSVPNGRGLHVIAGNITLDQGSADGVAERGTTLAAPSGNLTLFSAASAGEVAFGLGSPGSGYASATNTSFGTITLQNQSRIAIDGAGGGSVVSWSSIIPRSVRLIVAPSRAETFRFRQARCRLKMPARSAASRHPPAMAEMSPSARNPWISTARPRRPATRVLSRAQTQARPAIRDR
jgi:filamentous hemagglutinin family protein